LQRGGNKISGLPPLQGGIKGGKSDLCVHGSLAKGDTVFWVLYFLDTYTGISILNSVPTPTLEKHSNRP
jgi:hypothetical protein